MHSAPNNNPKADGEKQRVWITAAELESLKRILGDHLGEQSLALIPFAEVVPCLRKADPQRIIWCRTARSAFAHWGLSVGVRHRRSAYLVKVIDPARWAEACRGICADPEPPMDPAPPAPPADDEPELSRLVPALDPDYVMPEWSDHLRTVLHHGARVMLTGPAGCGKTSIARQLAAELRRPFVRVNLSGETSVSDLLGAWKIQGREMVFRPGPVTLAVQSGAWLVLDELDAASPAVLFALQSLLEEDGQLHLPELNQWLTPHGEFRVLATANTLGRGDDSGLFAGVQVLNEAFLDRFHAVFELDYLPRADERRLVRRKVPRLETRTLERMLAVADELRRALREGLVCSTFSTRKLLAWASRTVQLESLELATRYTVLNKLSADDRAVVAEIMQRHGVAVTQHA